MSAAGVALAQARGHRVDAQVAGLDAGDLVPVQRAGHARVRGRAHRVAGGHRSVAGVLVVVDEHAVALLLPPLARREVGSATLDLARERQRGAADAERVPLGHDPDVDVDPLRARRLRVAAQAVVGEHVADDERGAAHDVPLDARRRVEVDAQLVGRVQVVAARRPGVEVDHAEVDRPHQVRGIVGDELLGRAPGGERHGRGLQPLRHVARDALLPDRLLEDAVDEALEHGRALAQVDRHRLRRLEVVLDEVELRPAGVREVHLGRVGQPDLAPRRLDHRELALGHRQGA